MTKDFEGRLYERSLKTLSLSRSKTHVLSRFWRNPNRWPRRTDEKLFIGESFDPVGRLLHNNEWTGKELRAAREIQPLPPFSGTLAYFLENDRDKLALHSLDISDDIPREPDLTPPITKQELMTRMKAYHEQLAARFIDLRPIYIDMAREIGAEDSKEVGAAHRMITTIDWVIGEARSGRLRTYLKLSNSRGHITKFVLAPDGFWISDFPIRDRLSDGRVSLHWHPDSGRATKEELFYNIYFDINDIDRLNSNPKGEQVNAEIGLLANKAPIVAFLVSVVSDAPPALLDPQTPISDLREWILLNAPVELSISDNQAKYMATFCRIPEAKRGGAKRQQKRSTSAGQS